MVPVQIKKVSAYLQSLTKRQFLIYILCFLCGVFVIAIATIYFFFSYSHDLEFQIKKTALLSQRSQAIIAEHERLVAEKKKLQELFAKDKEFSDIKVYFEQFYKQQGLTPVKGWDTTAREVSPDYTEILLNATFKGLSMQKIVTMLDVLQKKEVVYVKGLTIRSEGSKQVSADILLATAQQRQSAE